MKQWLKINFQQQRGNTNKPVLPFAGDSCPEAGTGALTCAKTLCPYNKVCQYNPYSGPLCVCPEGKTGEFCERDLPGLGRCTDYSCYKGGYARDSGPEGKTGEFCERDLPGLGRCTDYSCYKGGYAKGSGPFVDSFLKNVVISYTDVFKLIG